MRDLGGVLGDAGRLFVRHWPALVVLGLVAAALRSACLWAAVEVSDRSGQLAQVLLILAPIGFLLPFIAMLAICQGSLPSGLLEVAVSVLVSWLVVYQSSGMLEEDVSRFRNLAAYDEFNRLSLTDPLEYDYAGRLGILSLQVAVVVVLAAWVVRWVLGKVQGATRLVGLVLLGALVEIYYTSQLAGQAVVFKTEGVPWLEDRVAVTWFEDGYDAVVDALGFLGGPLDLLVAGVTAVLSTLDAVVVLPVAWLAVGAVVLGQTISEPAGDHEPEQSTEDAEAAEDDRGLWRSLLADVRARFAPLLDALRLLVSAGPAPMLAFGLALVVASRIPVLVSEVARLLIGPISTFDWLAIAPMEQSLGLALWLAVTAPLVVAAVSWLASRQEQDRVPQGAGSST